MEYSKLLTSKVSLQHFLEGDLSLYVKLISFSYFFFEFGDLGFGVNFGIVKSMYLVKVILILQYNSQKNMTLIQQNLDLK